MNTYSEIKKKQKRLQRIAFATTDYNVAKNEFFNDKTEKSANALIKVAGNLIKLQKMHNMSIQDNASIQARIDTAKVYLKSAEPNHSEKNVSEAAIKKVGKRIAETLKR